MELGTKKDLIAALQQEMTGEKEDAAEQRYDVSTGTIYCKDNSVFKINEVEMARDVMTRKVRECKENHDVSNMKIYRIVETVLDLYLDKFKDKN